MRKIHAVIFIVTPLLSRLTAFLRGEAKPESGQVPLWIDTADFGNDTTATILIDNTDPPRIRATLNYNNLEKMGTEDRTEVLGEYCFTLPDKEFILHVRSEPSPKYLHCPTCGCGDFKEMMIKTTVQAGVKLQANGDSVCDSGPNNSLYIPGCCTVYFCQDCQSAYKVTESGLAPALYNEEPETGEFDRLEVQAALIKAFKNMGLDLNSLDELELPESDGIYLRHTNGSFNIIGLSEEIYITPDGPYLLVTVGNKTARCPDAETAASSAALFCRQLTTSPLIRKYGVWGEHPSYARQDWQDEVNAGDTGRSYWDWVASMIEQVQDEPEQLAHKVLSVMPLGDGSEVAPPSPITPDLDVIKALHEAVVGSLLDAYQYPDHSNGRADGMKAYQEASATWQKVIEIACRHNQKICHDCAPKEVTTNG